jgi:hypothetical protein
LILRKNNNRNNNNKNKIQKYLKLNWKERDSDKKKKELRENRNFLKDLNQLNWQNQKMHLIFKKLSNSMGIIN